MIKVIYNIFRAFIRLIVKIILLIICEIIYAVCWEKEKGITKRKIRRIRFFTKFKIVIWRKMPHLMKFLGFNEYLEYVDKKFGYGM